MRLQPRFARPVRAQGPAPILLQTPAPHDMDCPRHGSLLESSEAATVLKVKRLGGGGGQSPPGAGVRPGHGPPRQDRPAGCSSTGPVRGHAAAAGTSPARRGPAGVAGAGSWSPCRPRSASGRRRRNWWAPGLTTTWRSWEGKWPNWTGTPPPCCRATQSGKPGPDCCAPSPAWARSWAPPSSPNCTNWDTPAPRQSPPLYQVRGTFRLA